ncbi:NfeD family protein [Salinicola halophilus]|uniref:NfeD family protein n=1 Tax=Salinicola halophilus TaxID=184065 RepID=UPI001EF75977|nr:nodulation protein NfeD [Salinicola halophilus]
MHYAQTMTPFPPFSLQDRQCRRGRWRLIAWVCLLALGLVWSLAGLSQSPAERVSILTLDDSLNPATRDYLERGIHDAEASGAALVIIEVDTPGGQVESLRRLAQTILAAEVPVVSYVTPSGARAASAGTYLLYASHVAAMTPGTHLGSATPVVLGEQGGGSGGSDDENTQGERPAGGESDDMRRKRIEDAVAMIRGYAERNGRNAEWAERAVREAANLSAEEALSRSVIDVVATDIDDLLAQLDGREVTLADGERELATTDLEPIREAPGWRTTLLSLIANPTVAYGLLLLGFYGLVFELASPGTLVPGVVGGISLVLGLFAFQVLSLDLAGLGLVLLGLAMIVGEAFIPSFGALGAGGIAAFSIGSVMLMDGANSAFAWPLIGGTAAIAAGFLLWGVLRVYQMRRRLPQTGREEMIGARAVALGDFAGGRGKVQLHGERWQARSETPVARGDVLQVVALDGLVVTVSPPEVAGTPER